MILVSYLAKAAKVMMLTMGYKDAGDAQIFKDQNDVNSLREQFQQFHVFDYINI